MDNTSYIALSRQSVLWRQLEVVANNIANSNTPAFRGEHPLFVEHLMKTQNNQRPFDDKLSFVNDIGLVRDLNEGPMSHTGGPLDIALHGDGYLTVDTDDGPRYTRGGRMRLDETGQLVTAEGLPVLSTNDRPFFFAPNESQITISRDGTVATENGPIGKLRVVNFADAQALRRAAGGLYETDQRPDDVERPEVLQGMVEESNVKPVVEITRLIQISRSYEGTNRMIEMEHERQRKTVETVLRTVA